MRVGWLAALALAAPAAAQAPDGPGPKPIYITMTDHGFEPQEIVLHTDARYVLHVTNRSDKGHNLTQKVFFRLARIAPEDRGWVRGGQISLDAHQSAVVRLRAPASRPGGAYQFSSTTLGDAAGEYKGVFVMR